MKIQVFGHIHQKTKHITDSIMEVLAEHGLTDTIEHVTDAALLLEMGLSENPVVLINEIQIRISNNPTKEEIKAEVLKFIRKEEKILLKKKLLKVNR